MRIHNLILLLSLLAVSASAQTFRGAINGLWKTHRALCWPERRLRL